MTIWADQVWTLSYPLKLLGVDLRKNVTIIRLRNGQLILHSCGPFTADDVRAISGVGQVGWIVEAMLRHDTFASQGRAAFPGIPFLAPEGFAKRVSFAVDPIIPTPEAWHAEIDVLELQGVPAMRETVMLHRASRTLIVADLAFNFPGRLSWWSRAVLRLAVGRERAPGISRSFPLLLKDRAAFAGSLRQLFRWDFDRLIVGHGEPIERGARRLLRERLQAAGFPVE